MRESRLEVRWDVRRALDKEGEKYGIGEVGLEAKDCAKQIWNSV